MDCDPNSNRGKACSLAAVLIFILSSAFFPPLTWEKDDSTCSRYIPVANQPTPAIMEHNEYRNANAPDYLMEKSVRAFCEQEAYPASKSSRFSLGMMRVLQMPIPINDLNSDDWESLSGIGPKIAQKIIETRSRKGGFSSLKDLSQVPGIGPGRMMVLQAAINGVDQCPKEHFACKNRSVKIPPSKTCRVRCGF